MEAEGSNIQAAWFTTINRPFVPTILFSHAHTEPLHVSGAVRHRFPPVLRNAPPQKKSFKTKHGYRIDRASGV